MSEIINDVGKRMSQSVPLRLIYKLLEIPVVEVIAAARRTLGPAPILDPEVKVHTGIRRGELSLRLGYVATRPTLPRE